MAVSMIEQEVLLGEPRNALNPLLVKPPLGRPLTRCYTAPFNASEVSQESHYLAINITLSVNRVNMYSNSYFISYLDIRTELQLH